MCNPSWQTKLRQAIQSRQQADRLARVAILGIGQELHGDDAAGVLVARALAARLGQHDRLLVIEAGIAPENHTGALRVFEPDLVVLVDAAHMEADPGSVEWLAWQHTTGISASSHTLPPYMLAKFLTLDLGCEVALLGLQPLHNAFDSPPSALMLAVIEQVVEGLAAELAG